MERKVGFLKDTAVRIFVLNGVIENLDNFRNDTEIETVFTHVVKFTIANKKI